MTGETLVFFDVMNRASFSLTLESLGMVGFSAVALFLYGLFFYWYATRNRRIDVYTEPRALNWKVRTGLLILGTSVILALSLTSSFVNDFISGSISYAPSMAATWVNMLAVPVFLLAGLISLVLWPAGFFLGVFFYGGYFYFFLGILPICISFLFSATYAVETLIMRLKAANYISEAGFLEEHGKVGFFGIFLGIFGPIALFARLIRRGTKKGTVKITLSITQARTHTTERYVVVNLPEMAKSKEQVAEQYNSAKPPRPATDAVESS